jgi:hypothetical protein
MRYKPVRRKPHCTAASFLRFAPAFRGPSLSRPRPYAAPAFRGPGLSRPQPFAAQPFAAPAFRGPGLSRSRPVSRGPISRHWGNPYGPRQGDRMTDDRQNQHGPIAGGFRLRAIPPGLGRLMAGRTPGAGERPRWDADWDAHRNAKNHGGGYAGRDGNLARSDGHVGRKRGSLEAGTRERLAPCPVHLGRRSGGSRSWRARLSVAARAGLRHRPGVKAGGVP